MKTVKIFLGAFALLAASVASAPLAAAQEDGNRDENGKIVRGPYLTNKLGDNWFVGAAGGLNIFADGNYKAGVAPALDINFGKWVYPSVGVRFGYNGLSGAIWSYSPSILGDVFNDSKSMYKQRFRSAYIHADVLWNASHAIWGYKETRFWNLIPYFHSGWHLTYEKSNATKFRDQEFQMGFGLLNNLRLCKRLDFTIDVRGNILNRRAHNTVGVCGYITTTLGLAVNLGKTNWVRASNWHNPADEARIAAAEDCAAALAAANDALAALEAENKNLNDDLGSLKDENEDLKDKFRNLKPVRETVAPAVLFFELGKSHLSDIELEHLDFIAKNVIGKAEEDGNILDITILGTADANTGSDLINQQLCEERGQYVYEILTGKYGISKDRVAVRTDIVDAKEENPSLFRSVIISFE